MTYLVLWIKRGEKWLEDYTWWTKFSTSTNYASLPLVINFSNFDTMVSSNFVPFFAFIFVIGVIFYTTCTSFTITTCTGRPGMWSFTTCTSIVVIFIITRGRIRIIFSLVLGFITRLVRFWPCEIETQGTFDPVNDLMNAAGGGIVYLFSIWWSRGGWGRRFVAVLTWIIIVWLRCSILFHG